MSIRVENSILVAPRETGIIVVWGPVKEGELTSNAPDYTQRNFV
jgi:hypothetical protein